MSSEDFKSFVVTDPDILDEGIDISGLRKTTDTSPLLLGDLEPGLRYDPTLQSSYSDLLQYFSGGLPMLPETPAKVIPPATGGGGSGSGGQATTPITTPVTTPTITPTTISPFVETSPNVLSATDPATGQPTSGNIVDPRTGDVFAPGDYSDVAGTLADPREKIDFTPEQQGTIQNILGQAGQTVGGALSAFGKIPGAVVDAASQTVDLFGKKINVGKTLASAAINKIAGGPVSLIFEAGKALLPERDPRQTKLDEFYTEGEGAKFLDPSSPDYIPGMEDYNTVSGGFLNTITGGRAGTPTTYGLQGAYQKRIDTIENTLKNKYNMSDAEIADAKAGKYKGDVDSDLIKRIEDLGDAKKAEADILGITAAEDKRLGEAEMRQTIAAAERDFDATPSQPVTGVEGPPSQISGPQVTAPVTGVTRPGTVLGKPGIERFDDAEASIDMFDDTPPGASKTGTPIDALNPINRQQHFDNTEKLKDAVRAGEITPEEYNRLSAFDATKTMGLGPVTGTASAIGYQAVQTLAGDQNVSDFIEDTARNIQGVSGNITPEEQVKYQEIITGEKIYRDPILGMVEPPAPMTLADDFGDAFSYLDDIDISQDTPTAPIATDRIGTFDADTFDDDVSFVGPQPTTELTDSDFTAQDKQDIFNKERELENEYMEETGQVPTEGQFLGQAINEVVDKKTTAPTSITPLEDDFDFDDIQTYEPPAPPTPTVPDFISGGGRDRDPDPAPSAPVSTAGQAGPPSQRGRSPGPRGGGADAASSDFGRENVGSSPTGISGPPGRGGSSGGPPSQGGGGDGGGDGCFLKGTQVTMADGSTKAIEQVDLGDKVAKGGKVFATGKFLVENLHDYKGIKVSGSHMVSEDGNWVRVEDSKHGKSLGDDEHTVYVFGSENRRILINGITFTDYFEVNEQDKLLNNEKDFFNNWKNYAGKDSQNNVEIINAI